MTQTLHYRKLPVLALFTALLFLGGTVMAQKTWSGGAAGSWNTAANWTPAGVPAIGDAVTINNSAAITFSASVNAASLAITGNSTVSFAPSAGAVSLTLNGTGTVLDVQSGSTLNLTGRNAGGNNTMSLLFAAGAGKTATIAGNLGVAIAGGGDVGIFNTTNVAATVSGSIRQNGGTLTTTAGTLTIGASGTYLHNTDAGAIVTATWTTGSTVEVTGVTGTLPTNITAGYTNLIWNCTGQTGDVAFNANMAIPGNLTVSATNGNLLLLTTTATARTMSVGGNFIVSGTGEFRANNGSGAATITVTGNYTQSGAASDVVISDGNNATASSMTVGGNFSVSGGNFRVTNNSGPATLGVTGDMSVSGGLFRGVSGTGAATVNVTGNLSQSGTGNFTLKEDQGSALLSVGRNLVKSAGTFIQRTGSAVGSSIVSVFGAFTNSGGTWDFSQSASASSTLNVAGDFTYSGGTLTETGTGTSAGNVVFNGNGIQTFTSGGTAISAGTLVNFTANANSTLQMATAATQLTGNIFTLSPNATLGIRATDGIANAGAAGNIRTATRNYDIAGRYLFNGTGAQNTGNGIPTGLTGQVAISNANGVTLDNAESIGNGGTVILTDGLFNAGTNLTLNTGAIISRGSGTITGTFQGTGDYDVVYTGSAKSAGPELQGGQGGATRLRNLTMNLGAATSNVIIGATTEMKGILTLTLGFLSTGGLTPLRMVDGATTSGGSPSSYVSGPITKLGNDAFVFPLGSGGNYRPVGISGSSASIGSGLASINNTVTASLSPGNPLKLFNRVYNGDMVSLTSCYFWNISRVETADPIYVWASTGPSGGASLNTDYLRACMVDIIPDPFPPINPAQLRVARYTGTLWDNLNNATPPVTVQSGNAWFIGAATPVTSFSPFAVGSAEAVLPVTLISFTALKDGGAVKLSWETASEQNSDYFEVERSSDGVNFSTVGKAAAAGNSSTVKKYSLTDNNPAAGRNFYRLRQVDLDGQFEYSKTVSVNMMENVAVSIYPNPVQTDVMVEYPKVGRGAIYKVIGMDGRVMISGNLQENSSQQRINLNNLQRGNYILLIQNDGQQYQQKIVKL